MRKLTPSLVAALQWLTKDAHRHKGAAGCRR